MRIEYTLEAQDFLEYQLYVASNTPEVKKQRRTTRLAMTVLLVLAGIVMSFLKQDVVPIIVFALVAVGWYFIYPLTDKNRYVKFYLSHVNTTYKNRIGQPNVFTLENEFISVATVGSESKFNVKDIEEIVDLKRTLLIRLKSGGAFIVAKNQVLNFEILRNTLEQTAQILEVPFKTFENWEWK